jgi:hypothetical protein
LHARSPLAPKRIIQALSSTTRAAASRKAEIAGKKRSRKSADAKG